MQKSENKIKPMYFWSDGYEEYGILRPDHKKIREDELVEVAETEENEFLFEPLDTVSVRQIKKRKLKRFLKSKVQRALEYVEWRARKYGRS
jgi:hypothetical protein